MSDTPLFSAVNKILSEKRCRFYMPGHKGIMQEPFTEIARYDITEIDGADSLYDAEEAIYSLEKEIASAYGSKYSLISAGGSTLCIQTMLYLASRRGNKIIAGRNIHRAAVNTMGLLGLQPVWLRQVMSENDRMSIDGIALQPSAYQIEKVLSKNPDAAAVYITSPDYYGQMADIAAISEVCEKYKVWLLVDNAHGAHLNTIGVKLHPIQLGATMCCDSFHKSLPCLTGASVLHINKENMYYSAKYTMSIFGSSSPSYPIMLSIDRALPLVVGTNDDLIKLSSKLSKLKAEIHNYGYEVIHNFLSDPIKLAIGYRKMGYTCSEFSKYIRDRKIEPEYVSDSVAVFMITQNNTYEEIDYLKQVLLSLPHKASLPTEKEIFKIPFQPVSIQEAMQRPHIEINVDDAKNRVSARMVSKCPPGVPIIIQGEEISEECIKRLKKAGIYKIFVLK